MQLAHYDEIRKWVFESTCAVAIRLKKKIVCRDHQGHAAHVMGCRHVECVTSVMVSHGVFGSYGGHGRHGTASTA